jgi:dienelactone hydrolase
MALKTKNVDYQDGQIALEGYYAADDKAGQKRPAVLVAHDWSGKNEFACHKAEKLAELGYVGFAIDMFGKGKRGQTKEEKSALIQPLVSDRQALQKRILAGFETLKTLEGVDTSRLGAIGFCFGGLCAIDLARSGADVKAIVSFHGLLHAPENLATHPIKASILALHGFDDPMVTMDKVTAFGNEMTHAKANWQLDIYGHAMHAFTNPQANDHDFGTVYNKQADTRSWVAMKNFFNEIFGE